MMERMLSAHDFSAGDFVSRVRRWQPDDDRVSGDHVLNPEFTQAMVSAKMRDAAVLVPVVDHGSEATLLLTRRADSLRKHSGQIAFPGGAIDPQDGTAEKAALREANEEIGLVEKQAEIIGHMPRYLTGSGFSITPVLAVVNTPLDLRLNPDEVADIFEVPLSFLMNPANHRRESRLFNGKERFYYAMPYQERFIWGITAGIIRGLYERLYV